MTPLQRASVELQAACGEYHTVADLEWLYGVLRRALTAQTRAYRKAIRAERDAVLARWDELARERSESDEDRALRTREDCARIVQGMNEAIGCVKAPRKGRR